MSFIFDGAFLFQRFHYVTKEKIFHSFWLFPFDSRVSWASSKLEFLNTITVRLSFLTWFQRLGLGLIGVIHNWIIISRDANWRLKHGENVVAIDAIYLFYDYYWRWMALPDKTKQLDNGIDIRIGVLSDKYVTTFD